MYSLHIKICIKAVGVAAKREHVLVWVLYEGRQEQKQEQHPEQQQQQQGVQKREGESRE